MALISLDLNQARQTANAFQSSSQSIDELRAQLQSQWARLVATWDGDSKHETEAEVRDLLNRCGQVAQLTKERSVKLTQIADRFELADENMPFAVKPIAWNKQTLEQANNVIPLYPIPLIEYETLEAEIQKRIQKLQKAGLSPDNSNIHLDKDIDIPIVGGHIKIEATIPSDQYDARGAQEILDKRGTIESLAQKYKVDPVLLAGVIAAEKDFDYNIFDAVQSVTGSVGIPFNGPGIASVHDETLRKAIQDMNDKHLPGASDANNYDWSPQHRSSFDGSAEGAAIVLAWLTNAKGSVNSTTDMAVVWGAYRTGVADLSPGSPPYGYSSDGFKKNEANDASGEFITGTNAYMSLPYFEFFKEKFK